MSEARSPIRIAYVISSTPYHSSISNELKKYEPSFPTVNVKLPDLPSRIIEVGRG